MDGLNDCKHGVIQRSCTRCRADAVTLKMHREANDVYPDETISGYFDMETGKELKDPQAFDTLALFIGREIISALDGEYETDADARERVDEALTTAAQE